VTTAEAVAAYTRVIETWGTGHLAGADEPRRTAELAFAVMLLRELRGGLHFAALRAYGVGVPDAVTVDPTGGRRRKRWTRPNWRSCGSG